MGNPGPVHLGQAGHLPAGQLTAQRSPLPPPGPDPAAALAVMSTVDPVLLLLTTCPDRASAERIAHALVGERLAACVTRLDGAQSTYRWQGR